MRLYDRYSLAKARGLSLRTGAQPMLYLPLIVCYCCKELYNKKKESLPNRISVFVLNIQVKSKSVFKSNNVSIYSDE